MSRLVVAVVITLAGAAARADITREVLTISLFQPLHAAAPPGDTGRLFIAERNGLIRILDLSSNTIVPIPFLNVSASIFLVGEGGLLSIAFHPDYSSNGFFFVHYTADIDPGAGIQLGNRISRFSVSGNPDLANAASESVFLEVSQPYTNHNGGQIAFRPGDADHYLYIGIGDGGNQCDPTGRGQDFTDKLASVLRIDVDAGPSGDVLNPLVPASNPFVGVAGDDAVWVYGLRNPYRFSFDQLSGDLYIADVGGDAREEVDFQAASSTGGENYGWNAMEGTLAPPLNCTGSPPALPGMVAPIHEYDHGGNGASIIGGHVYRGTSSPALIGRYFFADFVTGQVWSWRRVGDAAVDLQEHTSALNPDANGVTSFAEDANGELYIIDFQGTLARISDPNPVMTDFDQDLLPDAYETGTGTFISATDAGTDFNVPDTDGDGVLDGIEVDLATDPNNPLDFPPLSASQFRAWVSAVIALCAIASRKLSTPRN